MSYRIYIYEVHEYDPDEEGRIRYIKTALCEPHIKCDYLVELIDSIMECKFERGVPIELTEYNIYCLIKEDQLEYDWFDADDCEEARQILLGLLSEITFDGWIEIYYC